MFERYRELDPKSRRRIQNVAIFVVVATFLGAQYIEQARTPVVALTDGSGQLDPDIQYSFYPNEGNVVIVDGVKKKGVLFITYGEPEHKVMIFHSRNEMVLLSDTLEDIKYETVPTSQREQKVAELKRAYPEAIVEEQMVLTEGSGLLEPGVDYWFYPPKGRSVILEGAIALVDVDGSITYSEWDISVLQDGYGMGIGKDVYGKGGTYEFVDFEDQEREIAERKQQHPGAYVLINK